MASNTGRVEIKFLTDTKEIEAAKRTIADLEKNIDSALKTSASDDVSKAFNSMGSEAETASEKVDDVTDSVDRLGHETSQLGNDTDLGGLPDNIEQVGDKADKSTGGVKNLVSALGLLKVAGVAFNMVMGSVDDAISRVDTMRAFPKMMQQVGFTASDTEKSINRLSEGIQGLPTRLNDVVATTQQIALTTGDLNEATELTLALNNAFLASGSSSADASRGLEQFSQMLATGTVDMQSWRTLLETMPLALQTVAENFGYTGNAAKNDLFTAIQDGTITFDEFSQALIEANNAQGGFAELALTNSEGIATSFANIRTAVVNGVSKVIEALDELVENLTGKNIAQNFDELKVTVSSAFSTVANSIRSSTPYIRSAISIMRQLAPIVVGVGTAYAGLKIIQSVGGWMSASNKAIATAEVAKKGLTLVTRAMTAEEIASQGALTAAQTIYGVLTGQVSALAIAKQGLATVTAFLTSPLGLVASGLALVAGGAYYAYNAINTVGEETQTYIDKMKNLAEESQNLIDKTKESATTFNDTITDIDNNRLALKNLADEVVNLAGKEEKSAQDKALLKGKIDTLNSSVENLNLSYNEETDALNLSTEAIYARIDAMTDIARAEAAQERLKEIFKEQLEVQAQINKNMQEIQTSGQVGNEVVRTPGLQEVIDETATLNNTYNELAAEATQTEQILANSMNNMATVTEESTGRQIVALEQLSDEQQNVVSELQDYYTGLKDHTQNMFDEINDTIMTTTDAGDEVAKTSEQIFAEMQSTIEHNQEVVSTWADNMANLAQRGVDEGLLNELSRLGPEGAPYVQALVDASDEELASLSDTFSKGGDAALEALKESLGLEDFELEGLEGIITRAESTLAEEIENSGLSEIGGTIVEKIGEGISEADTSPISEAVGTTIIEQIPEWIESGSEGASEAGKNIVGKIGEGIQSSDGLQEPINTVLGQLPELFTGKNEEMQEAGKNLMDGAKMGVDGNKAQLTESTQTAATEALDGFKSASGVASPSTLYAQAAADIVAGAVNGINDNKATLTSATRAMATESVASFIEGSSGAYNAGVQLAEGFRSGLASRRNSIINTATSIANAASAAINKALVVKSPSRKGIYSGKMLGEGVEVGMESEIQNIEKMATRLAESAIPDMKPIDIQTALDMPYFRTANNSPVSATGKASNDSKLAELLTRIADKDTYIVLDDGTLVGKIAPKIDREIGNIAKDKARYGGAR